VLEQLLPNIIYIKQTHQLKFKQSIAQQQEGSLMKAASRIILLASALISSMAFATDKVTFQLDWLPGGDKAPVYVGIQEGFFAQQNIEVKIASGRGSTDAITKLATGQSDIGSADIGALMAAKARDDVPVVAVMPYFTQAPHAFFALQGSGIKTVKDVKGKKVATSPFSSSNAFLPLILEKNGLKLSDIKLVKTDPGALGPMLITGNADVIIAWVTNTALFRNQAKNAGKAVVEIPWSDAGLSLYSSSIVASQKFLNTRPEVARRFIKALAKSIRYTYAHPDRAGQDLHTLVPEADPKIVAEQIRGITKLVYNDVTSKDGFGIFTPKRLAQTWRYVAKANKLSATALDPQTTVDFSYQPE
jgi:NitT/TauT family transport system substrate-binding protein